MSRADDVERELGFAAAVKAEEVDTLPDAPGLYAIWQTTEALLLYLGMSESTDGRRPQTIRRRLRDYLRGTRENETLYVRLLNYLRPDLTMDTRNVVDIARAFLRDDCRFAGWPWDGVGPSLKRAESFWRDCGIGGDQPLLNPPGRRSLDP